MRATDAAWPPERGSFSAAVLRLSNSTGPPTPSVRLPGQTFERDALVVFGGRRPDAPFLSTFTVLDDMWMFRFDTQRCVAAVRLGPVVSPAHAHPPPGGRKFPYRAPR